MLFSDRLRLADEFIEWAEKNGVLPLLGKSKKKIIEKIALQVIGFLQIKGYIRKANERKGQT